MPTCCYRDQGEVEKDIVDMCTLCSCVCFFLTGDEEFDELCFEFGIELDEVVSNK